MGIYRMTTFMNQNSTKYFENLQLKDTLVIIDGFAITNALYQLYERKTSAFGGDYDVLAKVYIDFINLLKRCNITPIFVFDGAIENRKMDTIISRMNSKIKSYGKYIKSTECKPLFCSHIIFDILIDMDIPHVNCDFEADAEIVALAKLFKCPVISLDSDFYINTVAFIPLDKIILDLDAKVVNCQVFKVEKLLDALGGLNLDYLPLVSALLGNDYIKHDTFSSLLCIHPYRFNFETKLIRTLTFLREQHDIESAISNMTDTLQYNSDYVKSQIQLIISEYKNIDSKYLSFILQFEKMSTHRDRLRHLNLKPKEKSILPPWLEYNYRRGTINAEVLTIVTLKKIFFKPQIEDYEKLPYYEISFQIIERIIGLLLGNCESISTFGRKNGFEIGEYHIKHYITNPYVPLADLNKSEIVYRKNILLNLADIKKLDGVPKDMELFVLSLIYWAVQTNNNSKHMHALIVCAITLNVIIKKIEIDPKHKITEDNNNGKSVIEGNITRVKKEDCIKAMSVLSDYFQVGQYDDKNLYFKIIHSFTQFQSCVYFFMILNSLLDFPFDQCRIENFYKGTFLYNLCVQMENINDPEVFVTGTLFKKLDSLNNLYKSIIDHINVLLPVSKRRAIVTHDTDRDSRPKSKKTWTKQKYPQQTI